MDEIQEYESDAEYPSDVSSCQEESDNDLFGFTSPIHPEPNDSSNNFKPITDNLLTPEYSSTQATQILHTELRKLLKLSSNWWKLDADLITNLYQWRVTLTDFDGSLLGEDMKKYGIDGILLELRFGQDFPFSPPFIRLIKPRLLRFIDGGGGHITAGGSVCMDLLTASGWNPAYTIESVLLQVKMALLNPDPKPARLDPRNWMKEYEAGEARDAFIRVANQHGITFNLLDSKYVEFIGWKVPDSFMKNLFK